MFGRRDRARCAVTIALLFSDGFVERSTESSSDGLERFREAIECPRLVRHQWTIHRTLDPGPDRWVDTKDVALLG